MEITLLGCAGGRFAVFRGVRRAGGFLLREGDSLIHIDPGPGAFVYLNQLKIDPRNLKAIVLSHIHLDHSADLNTLIEASSDGGKLRGPLLICPRGAVFGRDRILLPYLVRRLSGLKILEEGKEYRVGKLLIRAVVKHKHHGVETFGFSFSDELIYISCGKFEESWLEKYPKGVKVMLVNTTFYKKRKYIEHLSVEDVITLAKNLKPKRILITHFSLEILEKGEENVAKEIEEKTGIETIPAKDFLNLEV